MNKEFFDALDLLEKERHIPKKYMLERVEAALMSAYKRDNAGATNVVVRVDADRKEIKLVKQLTVVEEVTNPKNEISLEEASNQGKRIYHVGDTYEVEVVPKNFGRISAQTAKQVIIQGIREAERNQLVKEYEEKKEEIVSAIVLRVDRTTGDATLEIGDNEMVLFAKDQIGVSENFQVGDRIKVYVSEIKRDAKGANILLSRTHPGLIKRLFELEVPEIQDGTVVIKAIAREAGSRTKIAVWSNNPDVDPVGACIGLKGARKNLISAEVPGEKIDIIKYSDNPEEYISSALAPATVISVTRLSENERIYRAIVDDDQLSLSIGKEGQNARLAARLTECKIDIKSKSKIESEIENSSDANGDDVKSEDAE